MPFFPTGWDLPDRSVRSMCCSRSFLKLPQNQRLCHEIWDFIFHIVNIYSPLAMPNKMFISVVTYGRLLKGYRSRTHFIFLVFGGESAEKIIYEGLFFTLFGFCLQKWHCVEEITGKWRIQKCKGGSKEGSRKRARSLKPRSSYDNKERGCDCGDALFRPSRAERRSHRQFSSSSGQRKYTDRVFQNNIWLSGCKKLFQFKVWATVLA